MGLSLLEILRKSQRQRAEIEARRSNSSMEGLGDRLDAAIARHKADPGAAAREDRAHADELVGWYRRLEVEGKAHLVDPKTLRLDRALIRAAGIEMTEEQRA
jgi:hypothetical protein